MGLIEAVIGSVRQLPVRGKGRLFHRLTPLSGVRDVPVWGAYRMTLDLADGVQRMMFMGCFGHEIAQVIHRLLRPGGQYLDAGAHIGYFALLAAHRVGPTGRVFAAEPNPGMYPLLRRMIDANRLTHVRAEPVALGAADGTLRLYVPPPEEHRPHNVTCVPTPGWTPVDVPCRRLDDCLAEWQAGPIDLMKMDVEGSEPKVLAGGAKALAAGVVRHVLTEVNGPWLAEVGSSPAALVGQFQDLGFLPATLSGRRAVPVPLSTWDISPASNEDRLFVHRTAVPG